MAPPLPTATHPSTTRARSRVRLIAPFVLVLAPLVAVSIRIVRIGGRVTFWGDQALTDIAAGRALTFDELLGPYSRFGWHHPGPTWLFVLGLGRRVGGGGAAATTVAAVAVHAVAAVLVVVAGRRIAGEVGAWVAALAALAVMQTLGIAERVGYVWGPWAIVLPALLYVALCVLVADHRRPLAPPAAGVLLCGSFMLQTDVATGLLVVLLPLVALGLRGLAVYLDQRRYLSDRPRPPKLTRRATTLTVLGVVALALMWTPPLIEQFSHHPGNLTQLERYARESHGDQTTTAALVAVGNELRAFPFLKDTPEPLQETDNTIYAHMGRQYQYTPYAYLAAAAVLAAIALWRRDRTAFILAALGAAGVVIAFQSARMADGLLFPYLLVWAGVAAVPVWAAAVSLIVGWLRPRAGAASAYSLPARVGAGALAGLAVLVSAACVYQAVHDAELDPHITFPGGREAVAAAAPVLDATRGPVLLHLVTSGAMPVAAAIADELYGEGRPYRVNRQFLFMFGEAAKPRGDERVELYLARIEDNLPPPPYGREIALVRNTRIYVIDRPAVADES